MGTSEKLVPTSGTLFPDELATGKLFPTPDGLVPDKSTPDKQCSFHLQGNILTRTVSVCGYVLSSYIDISDIAVTVEEAQSDMLGTWWRACLRGSTVKPTEPSLRTEPRQRTGAYRTTSGVPVSRAASSIKSSIKSTTTRHRAEPIRVVDLFSGAGGLMVGVRQLVAEAGLRVTCELAVDIDSDALQVHARNHRTRMTSSQSVLSLVDYRIAGNSCPSNNSPGSGYSAEFVYKPTLIDDDMRKACEGVDLMVAGPPCQGHSNLNNHSRRKDMRNFLYLAVPAFAVACNARAVVIENVTAVVHDSAGVVNTARELLESSKYRVTEGVLAADAMGWPQTRKRHFLVARRSAHPVPLSAVSSALADIPARSVMWAIGHGEKLAQNPMMHESSNFTGANLKRINWLFDNDAYDLALSERPECHQNGTNYTAVYGRMHPNRPAPTITTGYMTPGRGRFVHPTERRTVTAAEAARLQGFPDSYRFQPVPGQRPGRTQLAKWIGDAVAAPLGYGAALAALAPQIARVSQ